jgi:hypothetical protein
MYDAKPITSPQIKGDYVNYDHIIDFVSCFLADFNVLAQDYEWRDRK